jgi:hypothetical protein
MKLIDQQHDHDDLTKDQWKHHDNDQYQFSAQYSTENHILRVIDRNPQRERTGLMALASSLHSSLR